MALLFPQADRSAWLEVRSWLTLSIAALPHVSPAARAAALGPYLPKGVLPAELEGLAVQGDRCRGHRRQQQQQQQQGGRDRGREKATGGGGRGREGSSERRAAQRTGGGSQRDAEGQQGEGKKEGEEEQESALAREVQGAALELLCEQQLQQVSRFAPLLLL